MARTIYYLTHLEHLRQAPNRPRSYFLDHGVVPIITLAGNGTNVFQPNYSPAEDLREIRERLAGPYVIGFWADNVRRDEQPGGSTLFTWDDDAGWVTLLVNLARIRVQAQAAGASGIAWDGEIYTVTRRNNGGEMAKNPAGAWPDGARLRERAEAFGKAHAGLKLLQYVTVADARLLAGWPEFWRHAYKAAAPGIEGRLLLDEGGYTRQQDAVAFRRLVTNVPGRAVQRGVLDEEPELPRGKDVWLYPWLQDQPLDQAMKRLRKVR